MTSSLVPPQASAAAGSPALVHDLARRRELGPALAAWHDVPGPGTLVCGPRGHVLAPEHTLRDATRVRWAAGWSDRASLTETECTPVAVAGAGVHALRLTGPMPEEPPGSSAREDHAAVAQGLLWLRLGLSRALLDSCLSYLEGRTTGGVPLLRQQLVRGAVADGLMEQLEIESALLAWAPEPGCRETAEAALHDQLTRADRGLVRLLGAGGFTCDEAGCTAYVSELLADAYSGATAEPLAAERGGDSA
ncbi:MAG: hypothetical protein HOZ81_09005 [Streptomyces sp.]|nr:hypothetical protein [Streptomyces sp.]NUS23663.1 hypothetical protein [Streptomyces sp.]